MKNFNLGRFIMPKNPLLDEIETPEGTTDAYWEIQCLLEQKAEDLWDVCRPDAEMYIEVKNKFLELKELLK